MRFINATLWVAAGFNMLGAYIFAFPDSAIGNYYELPSQVPPLYAALTSFMVFLFGLMYAWLAAQPSVVRPLLYLGAFGKGGFFLVAVALWLVGAVGLSSVMLLSGDGVFAILWFSYLFRNRTNNAGVA